MSIDLDRDERRAVDARQVLESAIYKEAFSTIEDRLIGQLAVIEITKERAEYLRQLLVANRKIKAYLEQVIVTGKMAEEHRTLMERAQGAARSFLN